MLPLLLGLGAIGIGGGYFLYKSMEEVDPSSCLYKAKRDGYLDKDAISFCYKQIEKKSKNSVWSKYVFPTLLLGLGTFAIYWLYKHSRRERVVLNQNAKALEGFSVSIDKNVHKLIKTVVEL